MASPICQGLAGERQHRRIGELEQEKADTEDEQPEIAVEAEPVGSQRGCHGMLVLRRSDGAREMDVLRPDPDKRHEQRDRQRGGH